VAEQRVQRQLTAILAADVAGYSRLIGFDEEGTLDRLKELRRTLIDPQINEHRGRIVKTMGDGLLVQFGSVVDAVRCAVDIQRQMAAQHAATAEDRRIEFRMGVNLGDVVIDGDDIHGDGVNVASRLEGLATPGGICVSGAVHDQVRDKLDLTFDDAGEQQLKNIARPMRVYRARVDATAIKTAERLPLPDKPSIAVLPFQNMSGDLEQEYFADGMVEEIITALSRFQQLFVIARNSSFAYKGRSVDVKQVGRELGVRYVLEGSVRKSANRIRITGQLIDTSAGGHLWADRFEGGLDDIFDLQDQVAASVVGAIAPKLVQAEIDRSSRKPTDSLDAYDYYLRGIAGVHQWTREATAEGLSNFYHAIERDPGFGLAYGMAARCYSLRKASGWETDHERAIAEVTRLARRAVELAKNDALTLATAGIALAFVGGEAEDGDAMIDRALALNPNLAWAWLFSGWVKVWNGEPELALERIARALRLSPHDPHLFSMYSAAAMAHLFAGRYMEARTWAGSAMREQPNTLMATCTAAASAALAGYEGQAAKAMLRLRSLDPNLRISNLRNWFPIRRSEDFSIWSEGLRKAGLPE
jgi:TolB-like protein/Tfp pilus assembly protein PilF